MTGYHPCACRDCFETVVGHVGTLCRVCTVARCDRDGVSECCAPGAYGAEEPSACPACGGEGALLGALGKLTHHRCRSCGLDFSC